MLLKLTTFSKLLQKDLINATDEFTTQIQDGCDVFVSLAGLSPEAAARRIHDDGIHILIDLLGYTTFSRPKIFVSGHAYLISGDV